ncbi:MAG: extracellular solute-binding protein [Clostridia bacterium]
MKIQKILALILCLCVLAAPAAAQQSAMGRYVERELALPSGMDGVFDLYTLEDGRIGLLGVSGTQFMTAQLCEDGRWACQVPGWAEQIADPYAFCSATMRGETACLLAYPTKDAPYRVLIGEGAALTPLDAVDFSQDVPYPGAARLAQDGTLIVQGGKGTYTYDAATGARKSCLDRVNGPMAYAGGKLSALSVQEQGAVIYDVATGELRGEMSGAPLMEDNAISADGEALYLGNAGGIYRIAQGGSVWERLVDGSLTSLCMPALYPRTMAVSGDTLYMLLEGGENGTKLFCYTYDQTVSTLPTQELTIYTLRDNQLLTQAAAVFQLANPDYIVRVVQLLTEDAGATSEDVIRALNAELLSGKGPDVLLLDGMPADAYIQKGVLADLTSVVAPMLSEDVLLPNLIAPFQTGDAIYQVPTRVMLPIMLGNTESATWEQLVSALSGGLTLPPRTLKGYTELFLPANFPAWFDRAGTLDEALFSRYLSDVVAIHALCGEPEGGQSEERARFFQRMILAGYADPMNGYASQLDEIVQVASGKLAMAPMMLNGLSVDSMPLSQFKGAESLSFLPGQAGKVFAPLSRLGVNARGAQVETAMAFVKMMLSEEVQDASLFGGMPVNRRALQKLNERESDSLLGTTFKDTESGEELNVEGHWPDKAMREAVYAMLTQAECAYLPDETLLTLLQGALEPFYAGQMDAAQAAQQVSAKVRAYLAE